MMPPRTYRADRDSWTMPVKTINGVKLELFATKQSRRSGRTSYFYKYGTKIIFNQSKDGVMFLEMPRNSRTQHYRILLAKTHDFQDLAWLSRNDYALKMYGYCGARRGRERRA